MIRLIVIALAVLSIAGCGESAQTILGTTPNEEIVADPPPTLLKFTELAFPDAPERIPDFKFLPNSDELLFLEHKVGRVDHYQLNSDDNSLTKLGDFEVDVFGSGDCGLISMAVDPDFVTNKFLYFGLCHSIKGSQIVRIKFDPTDYEATAASRALIFEVEEELSELPQHNVGAIGFDDDKNLWALFGDKRNTANAQDLSNNAGALVLITPNRDDDGDGYTSVPTNPFFGQEGKSPDIYAYGFRSPWKGVRDSLGRIWVGDVGGGSWEEVNVVETAGGNFAWPIWEGVCESECESFVQPKTFWEHSVDDSYSVSDPLAVPTPQRVVWVGVEYPSTVSTDRYDGLLTDSVLFGDFIGGWVRALRVDIAGNIVDDTFLAHLQVPSSWQIGGDGYIYVVTLGIYTGASEASKFLRVELNN